MKRINKRGASNHLEMILSFVLFLGFFFFVIIFLQPYETSVLTTSIVDGAYYNFLQYTNEEVVQFSIKINQAPKSCLSILLPTSFQGYNSVFVYDINNNFSNSKILNENIIVKNENLNSFFNIILVKDLVQPSEVLTCSNVYENYQIGGILNESIISYQKIQDLKNEYDSNYEKLKDVFAVPGKFDFAINSEIISLERPIPDNIKIMAKSYSEKVILENGTIINVEFIIRAW
ncbi:MAG: hypothetical protein WC260_03345 [Candidatus Pacearchaeota archaeon]